MRVLGEAELLALWERGVTLHQIDRALMLCAWARPDLPPTRLAELPLGTVNEALLQLRGACFGPEIDAYVDCEGCGERLSLAFKTEQLINGDSRGDTRAELNLCGLRFRLPNSRDLAAVAHEGDAEAGALRLLERCCIERPEGAATELSDLLAEAETALEALDPAADISVALACPACGQKVTAGLDAGELLWDEIEVRAKRLVTDVHDLAGTYGWTEQDVLALSPMRRAAYLNMVRG